MDEVHAHSTRPKRRWTTLAVAAISGAGAIALALPAATANADPVPPPGTTTAAPYVKRLSSPSTQVAEAVTTRPVLRSTARIDQVANADVWKQNHRAASNKNRRMKTSEAAIIPVLF